MPRPTAERTIRGMRAKGVKTARTRLPYAQRNAVQPAQDEARDGSYPRRHQATPKHPSRYDPDAMPADLREAHERNDEVLERIYIGRQFRNDTERLEKLFDLYTKMTASAPTKPARKAKA